MRLHACVLMLLLLGSSVAAASERKADDDFVWSIDLVAMRALVPADEIGGYEAFHLAVTLAVGPPRRVREDRSLRFNEGALHVKEGRKYFGSGKGRVTYDDALADWEALAQDGDPGAMSNLGVMYDLGLGVAPDAARAVELYRAAAERGSAVAQNNLGIAYFLGRGVERDKVQANQLLSAAAKKGLSLAENTLGVWYLIAGHERSGTVWLSRAVGRVLNFGDGVDRRGPFRAADHNLARLYDAKAGDHGFDEWFWSSVVARLKGWPPVPDDPLAAYNWFERAADAGFPADARKRDLAEAAERASTARWSFPLFSAPERVLKEEKALIQKIGRALCHSYDELNFKRLRKILRRSAERFIGREMPFERAYMYLQCDDDNLGPVDLFQVSAEDPTGFNMVAAEMIYYFADELQDKFLLGKILMCRRDYGHGCENVFERIERNLKIAKEDGRPYRAESLNYLKGLLHYDLDEEHLKRHLGLCRVFLQEPEHCGNR